MLNSTKLTLILDKLIELLELQFIAIKPTFAHSIIAYIATVWCLVWVAGWRHLGIAGWENMRMGFKCQMGMGWEWYHWNGRELVRIIMFLHIPTSNRTFHVWTTFMRILVAFQTHINLCDFCSYISYSSLSSFFVIFHRNGKQALTSTDDITVTDLITIAWHTSFSLKFASHNSVQLFPMYVVRAISTSLHYNTNLSSSLLSVVDNMLHKRVSWWRGNRPQRSLDSVCV